MSRGLAFDVLREVTGEGAYANLALAVALEDAKLSPRDAAFVTELVCGTCRLLLSYDRVIEMASGRGLSTMQPAVVDILRLGCHQVLSMRMPIHAAVSATVELAKRRIGRRVTGLVNAILRKIAKHSLKEWMDVAAKGEDMLGAIAVRGHHPRWIVEAFATVLPKQELEVALAANNQAPRPTLVVRPGLATVDELGGMATTWSPFGAVSQAPPGSNEAVRQGRAGVQDEGSQLVAWALTRADAVPGPWLDLCAGPGGKAALLAGMAQSSGTWLLANETKEHRARLVSRALAGYSSAMVIVADGTVQAWGQGVFAKVMADVPCSGLGALRRRPEARWRRSPEDVTALTKVQRRLLSSALDSALPGGVVAYVTCSPHRAETSEVVEAVLEEHGEAELLDAAALLPSVPNCAVGKFVQLWPHRHGTDAMFLAMLRRAGR